MRNSQPSFLRLGCDHGQGILKIVFESVYGSGGASRVGGSIPPDI